MDRQKAWRLIALTSWYTGLSIMIIVAVGGALIWHWQPGGSVVAILGWIATGLLVFTVGISVALPIVALFKKKRPAKQENVTAGQ